MKYNIDIKFQQHDKHYDGDIKTVFEERKTTSLSSYEALFLLYAPVFKSLVKSWYSDAETHLKLDHL